MTWQEFSKRICCLLVCCNSQIIVKNSQLHGKPPGMTKEELLKKLHYDLKNPAAYAGKFKLLQEAKKYDTGINRRCRKAVEIAVNIYLT